VLGTVEVTAFHDLGDTARSGRAAGSCRLPWPVVHVRPGCRVGPVGRAWVRWSADGPVAPVVLRPPSVAPALMPSRAGRSLMDRRTGWSREPLANPTSGCPRRSAVGLRRPDGPVGSGGGRPLRGRCWSGIFLLSCKRFNCLCHEWLRLVGYRRVSIWQSATGVRIPFVNDAWKWRRALSMTEARTPPTIAGEKLKS